jgi:multicomponent K+:H+ antiporter subunit F
MNAGLAAMPLLAWALDFALLCVAAAVVLVGWRLVRGPETTDRLLAFDTLYVNTAALAILLGLRWDTPLLFDAALIIAMLGFVGTVALARYLTRGDVIE